MIAMDLHQLRTFVAIADTGGVGRAALRLNLSQPAVSRQLLGLETELGIALFDRVGGTVRLTPQGEDLLQRSRHLLAEADLLRDRAHALQRGHAGLIKFGATPPMIEAILVDFLVGHRLRHPSTEIRIIEDGGAALEARLDRGDVHVAYIPAGSERFAGRLLYPIHVIAVIHETSPFFSRQTLEIAELAKEPLLVLRRGFGSREWFDSACTVAGLRPNVLLESSAHNALLGLAATGYGIAILPSAISMRSRQCRAIPLVNNDEPVGKWTMLAWDARRFVPAYANTFIDELVAHARKVYPGRQIVRRAPPLRKPDIGAASPS